MFPTQEEEEEKEEPCSPHVSQYTSCSPHVFQTSSSHHPMRSENPKSPIRLYFNVIIYM